MFVLTTKKWKKKPQKLLRKTQIHFFSLLPWAAQMAQTEKFMFQNVAYRTTVYRTRMTCIQWLWSSVIARDQKLISRPKPFDIRAILFYRVQRFPFWKKWQKETVPPNLFVLRLRRYYCRKMKVKKFVKTQYNKKNKGSKKRKRQMVHKNAKIKNCFGLNAISRDISFLNSYLLHMYKRRKKRRKKWFIKMP